MRKILSIITLSLLFFSCEKSPEQKEREEAIMVYDQYGHEYELITIEGCEFYKNYNQLTKIDCDCKPKRK